MQLNFKNRENEKCKSEKKKKVEANLRLAKASKP